MIPCAVLFDLDDTLFDHRHCARAALEAVRASHAAFAGVDRDEFELSHSRHLEALHLQVLAGLDDSFEWFGGTVDATHLVSYESGDDHFDMSEGYRGRLQHLIALQSARLTPRTGRPFISEKL